MIEDIDFYDLFKDKPDVDLEYVIKAMNTFGIENTLIDIASKGRDRWVEAEKYLINDPLYAYQYACAIDFRWYNAENTIAKSCQWSSLYAKYIIHGRFKKAEFCIKKNPQWAYFYAFNVIKGRWPEAEPYIKQDPRWAYNYAINILNSKWPEAEFMISTEPYFRMKYIKHFE